ncbi:MAG: hypothetical protein M3N26_04190 [Pseudomonadota bacterium]|nr:hypothetical protein [Pseudomonadota bacterium]
MSDDTMTHGDGSDSKHEAARQMAEAALKAEAAGDTARADTLLDQAEKADPSAVIDVVTERADQAIPGGADDDELSTMSETVQPGSDAPSRAGITGSGSGADNQGL